MTGKKHRYKTTIEVDVWVEAMISPEEPAHVSEISIFAVDAKRQVGGNNLSSILTDKHFESLENMILEGGLSDGRH